MNDNSGQPKPISEMQRGGDGGSERILTWLLNNPPNNQPDQSNFGVQIIDVDANQPNSQPDQSNFGDQIIDVEALSDYGHEHGSKYHKNLLFCGYNQ